MISNDIMVIRSGGIPLYSTYVGEFSFLKSGFYKAIFDFGRQSDSLLSRIEFLDGKCSYCHYFEEKDLLFFITVDAFRFKEGIIEKIKWLYEDIFKDMEIPTTGDMIKDEEIIKRVKDILSEQVVKKKVLEKQHRIHEICQNILKSPSIKAISIHAFDNTPVFFVGEELTKIREWLQNWNMSTPPEPFKFEFGNYLDKKSLQGIVMNSGISIITEKNFLLYYIFGDAANLGLHMDWLSVELNKVIG